jgi:tetratricopeptide (TPR) repeat protein
MKNSLFLLALLLAFSSRVIAQTASEGLRNVDIERFDDANRIFRQVLATAPTPENYFYAGFAFASNDKADSAIILWTKAGSLDPKSGLGRVALGSADILRGNLAGAKHHFEEAKKLTKNKNAEIFFRIGEAYTIYKTKDAGEAITHLTKAAELDKTRPDILVMLGDAYLIPNDGSAAATNYDRAIRMSPNYTKGYIRIGQVYERARSYQEAYKKYIEGMTRDSSYTPGYRYLAELQRKAKQQNQAIANYRKYIQRSDRNPEALTRFAGFLIEANQYKEAATYIAEVEGKTKNPLFNRVKAYALHKTGDFTNSEAALNQFVSTVDTSKIKIIGRDYFYLGEAALFTTKDTAKGLELMEKGIALDTVLREDLKLLGDSAFGRKQFKTATKFRQVYVKTAVKPVVNDYFTLGQAAFFANEHIIADDAFAKVTEVSEGRAPAGLLYRGYVAQRTDPEGKTGKAVQYWSDFLKVTSDTSKVPAKDAPKFAKQRSTAFAFLAREQYVKKDFKESERYVKLALTEDPANKQAIQMQEAIEKAKAQSAAKPDAATPPAKGKK